MLTFLFGISVCLNIVLILLIKFYLKIKSRKTKILNDLDNKLEDFIKNDDVDNNWNNFFNKMGD